LTEADLSLMTALSDHINIAITRARLYAHLRESEAKYRSVVGSIDEVIFQSDTEGKLIFLNSAWTPLTGYSVEECLDTRMVLYIHPEDRRAYHELQEPVLSGRKDAARCECRYMHRNGDVRWAEIHARRFENGGAKIIGIFGTVRDITGRKRMEEERLRLSKLEAISPLAGGIAHDFNNLLTGYSGQYLLCPDDAQTGRRRPAQRAA